VAWPLSLLDLNSERIPYQIPENPDVALAPFVRGFHSHKFDSLKCYVKYARGVNVAQMVAIKAIGSEEFSDLLDAIGITVPTELKSNIQIESTLSAEKYYFHGIFFME